MISNDESKKRLREHLQDQFFEEEEDGIITGWIVIKTVKGSDAEDYIEVESGDYFDVELPFWSVTGMLKYALDVAESNSAISSFNDDDESN